MCLVKKSWNISKIVCFCNQNWPRGGPEKGPLGPPIFAALGLIFFLKKKKSSIYENIAKYEVFACDVLRTKTAPKPQGGGGPRGPNGPPEGGLSDPKKVILYCNLQYILHFGGVPAGAFARSEKALTSTAKIINFCWFLMFFFYFRKMLKNVNF